MSLRNALRAGTSADHATVDDAFARFNLSDRADYGAFLLAHARAIPAWEGALEEGGIAALVPDWAERRRTDLLLADLDDLGLEAPAGLDVEPLDTADRLWGAVYVLEGSKLGGALLARSVPASLPSRYLATQGPKGSMKAFMDRLDAHFPQDEAQAIDAARRVFETFRDAAAAESRSVPA
ncbi:biliverdin-producing heme oxygenase [Ensifer soli]|uniref:biliverdin-producing heme oxygenase n=1 Tax=Ciceribacter sp. sgz301302 TaxID=3342379 RepID=UPI0035BB5007